MVEKFVQLRSEKLELMAQLLELPPEVRKTAVENVPGLSELDRECIRLRSSTYERPSLVYTLVPRRLITSIK